MAPAQPPPDIGADSNLTKNKNIFVNKENKSFMENSNQKGLRCVSNCEDAIFGMEAFLEKHTKAPEEIEDVEVVITKGANNRNNRLGDADDPDATEYSSSFGNTVSGTEYCSGLSEAEVESRFCGDNGFTSTFDTFGRMFHMRKKKLTSQWKRFIHPLMWRCKWTELRIKEIESQALKYAREFAAYDQSKPLELDQYTSEGHGLKSLPFSSPSRRRKAMKRRKRKRVEDTTDITSYMSNHNLFSYLENKKSDPDGSMADDFGNQDQNANCSDKPGINDDQSFLEFEGDDNSLEQILWKIEIVHSRLHKLKNQFESVMSTNDVKFSSSENLSLLAPCDVHTSSVQSPTFSIGNGEEMSVGAVYSPTQHISEYEIGEMVMLESAVSSYGEGNHVPDMVETTMEVFPEIGDSCEDIMNNAPNQNSVAEMERNTFEERNNQYMEKNQGPKISEQEENPNNPPFPVPESDPNATTVKLEEQSSLKPFLVSGIHIPTNKRKRGERKAGSGGWSLRCSGEHDSQ